MRPELETYQRIDRYLKNELAGEDLVDFQNQLDQDPSLAQEVALQKLVNQVVVGASYEELRISMRKDLPNWKPKTSFFNPWGFWTIALSVLLIVGWSVIQWKNNTNSPAPISNASMEVESKLPEEKEVTTNPTPISSSVPVQQEKANPAPKTTTLPPSTPISSAEVEVNKPSTEGNAKEEIGVPVEEPNTTVTVSKAPAEVKPDCKTAAIHLDPKIEPTCQGENSGKVIFPTTNSTKSLLISLKGTKTGANTAFYNLSAGDHTFYVIDENGCNFSQQIHVPEKSCKSNKFAFHPDLGETWKVPVSSTEDFHLSVFNKGGQLVYQQTTNSGSAQEWNGNSSNGNVVEPGLYIYVIEFADGRKESGQVSILK